MKRVIVLPCALYLILAYGLASAATPAKATTTLNDIPPAWSKTLQCDTTTCPRFELVMGGAAVLDHETGLVWEQSPNTNTYAWTNAFLVCQQRTIGNRQGWRLPTIEELQSLVDPTVAAPGPTLPSGHPFSNIQTSNVYWSASTDASSSTYALFVNFNNGFVNNSDKGNISYVWCVRGGQGYDGR